MADAANTLAPGSASQPTSAAASQEPSRATTPANAPVEKPPDDSSKLKTFLGVLRRYLAHDTNFGPVPVQHAHTWDMRAKADKVDITGS